ncbi:MAG: hypothetical protein ACRBDX_08085 [Gammaproteobacteria bacterium]
MVYYKDSNPDSIIDLLLRYGMQISDVGAGEDIPHSFWGSPEAGRIKDHLYIRGDTPLHSILHEACHYICMPADQRSLDQVDAKGTTTEENATCYLQILLSDHIEDYSRSQLMKDMDDWGYSFRLGSTHSWFFQDAQDTQQWLISQQVINEHGKPSWKLRK